MNRAVFLAPLAALALACSGTESVPPVIATLEAISTTASAQTTVNGTFVLAYERFRTSATGDSCEGSGGYADVAPGMQVRLLDGTTVLDVDSFSGGRVTAAKEVPYSPGKWSVECTFTFSLDVPRGHDFYTVEVGRRGERTYTFAQITSPGTLSFSLGQ